MEAWARMCGTDPATFAQQMGALAAQQAHQ
jgi:hypothetical protein